MALGNLAWSVAHKNLGVSAQISTAFYLNKIPHLLPRKKSRIVNLEAHDAEASRQDHKFTCLSRIPDWSTMWFCLYITNGGGVAFVAAWSLRPRWHPGTLPCAGTSERKALKSSAPKTSCTQQAGQGQKERFALPGTEWELESSPSIRQSVVPMINPVLLW